MEEDGGGLKMNYDGDMGSFRVLSNSSMVVVQGTVRRLGFHHYINVTLFAPFFSQPFLYAKDLPFNLDKRKTVLVNKKSFVMSDCSLCEMDLTDQRLKPCKCGYKTGVVEKCIGVNEDQ